MIVGSPNSRATPTFAGLAIDLSRDGHLLEAALAQHGDAVAERHGLLVVLGDVEDGRAEAREQPRQFQAHLVAQLGVDVAQRIVEQEHIGSATSARASAVRCFWPLDSSRG